MSRHCDKDMAPRPLVFSGLFSRACFPGLVFPGLFSRACLSGLFISTDCRGLAQSVLEMGRRALVRCLILCWQSVRRESPDSKGTQLPTSKETDHPAFPTATDRIFGNPLQWGIIGCGDMILPCLRTGLSLTCSCLDEIRFLADQKPQVMVDMGGVCGD